MGSGVIDWAGQFRALKADGYRHACTLETHWRGAGTPEESSRAELCRDEGAAAEGRSGCERRWQATRRLGLDDDSRRADWRRQHQRNARARGGARFRASPIAGVYAPTRAHAERLRAQHGGIACDTLDALLDHRPLDIVVIGSPSGLHAEHGIAAARRGLHVLVEKPIDVTDGAADALIDEAARGGRHARRDLSGSARSRTCGA